MCSTSTIHLANMQSVLQLFLLVVATASAFRATTGGRRYSHTSLQMASPLAGRVGKAVPALVVYAALALNFSPVQAANYGGFGSSYSEVINPKDAVLSEVGKSDEVKAAADKLKGLQDVVNGMRSDLSKDRQVELVSRVGKDLDAGVVRSVLNKYNEAFAEDTQRGTDRLIRQVVQDITELERDASVKPGKQRSEVKAGFLLKRLDATADRLAELAAFLPK